MKKILVHVHLFYKDMWPEFREYIRNILGYDYDLFVTMIDEDIAVQNAITEFNPNAKIIFCENRGYDIRPFVQVIQSVDMSEYSYVVKLHTKRDLKGTAFINGYLFQKDDWRKASCSFVESQSSFSKIIAHLETNLKTGMCASAYITLKMRSSRRTIWNFSKDRDKVAVQRYNEILAKNNLFSMPHFFIAGTIFIARAEIFDLLRCIDLEEFESATARSGGRGEYSHAVERFLGYCVAAHGMRIYDPLCTKREIVKRQFQAFFFKFKNFIYLHERNKAGKMRLKICKIPLPLHFFTKEK